MNRPSHRRATDPAPRPVDAILRGDGSVWTVLPLTDAASDWIMEHTPDDAPFLGESLVVEPRYIAPLVEGMIEAGLEVRRA